jgi:phosphoribosylformylglycinamidine cyclo-ligase
LHPADTIPELGASVSEILLAPHRSYYRFIEPLLDASCLKGMAHITGGGFTENLPRILAPGMSARIQKRTWPALSIFSYLQEKGEIEESEMYRTFNMGIGMILVVGDSDLQKVKDHFRTIHEPCYEIGSIVPGDGKVQYA